VTAPGGQAPPSRIVDILVERHAVPLRAPLRTRRGALGTRDVVLVHLLSEDGIGGAGEASRVDWLGDAVAGDDAILDLLVHRIRSDGPPPAALLAWSQDPAQPSAVRSAVQTALVDIEARRAGTSVAELLAGSGAAPPRDVSVSALLGDGDAAAASAEAGALGARGLRSFKWKVGRTSLEHDVECVRALREAIGPRAALRLDANGAWTADEARRALDAFAPWAPEFVEEPLRAAERRALAALGSSVPVALDESVVTMRDLDAALTAGGAQVLVLKLERVAGPLAALALAARAERAGLRVVFTDSIESVVGRAATAHVAAAFAARSGEAPAAVGLGGLFLLNDDDPQGGTDAAASVAIRGPGLGVHGDDEFGGARRP